MQIGGFITTNEVQLPVGLQLPPKVVACKLWEEAGDLPTRGACPSRAPCAGAAVTGSAAELQLRMRITTLLLAELARMQKIQSRMPTPPDLQSHRFMSWSSFRMLACLPREGNIERPWPVQSSDLSVTNYPSFSCAFGLFLTSADVQKSVH